MKKITKLVALSVLGLIIFLCGSKINAEETSVGTIEVKFCNYDQTNNELDITAKAGEKTTICIEFTNTANMPITINTEFLDSTITDDKTKNRACNASDRPKMQFGNFVLPYKGEVVLDPKKTIKKEYTIQYPIGFSGLSHGCLAYNIIGSDIKNSDMFMIRIRSIKYIDILVSDTQATQTLVISQTTRINKTGDEYTISLGLKNKGNIDEKVYITSIISNLLGYKQEKKFNTVIPANSGIIYTTPSFILPGYGGLFLLKSKISYTPQFNFNITDGKSISKIYEGGTKTIQKITFIWTRISGIIVLIIIFFITKNIRKQYKKREKKA